MKAKTGAYLYFLVILGSLSLLKAEDLIESYSIKKNRLYVKINEDFKARYLNDDFFVVYDEDINLNKLDKTIALLPFHLNIVTIVWISGKTYEIDAMDEDAYKSLQTIKEVFRRLYPKTNWDGELVPRTLVTNENHKRRKDSSKEIALLFSGGLDSTTSSFYHYKKKQLLITCWGQWDVPLEKPALWNARKADFLDFAQKYGHTNTFVKSNYGSFLNHDALLALSPEIRLWREDANEGIGMAGLVAPILVTKGYSQLLIASSFTWNYPYPSAANPLIDNNITLADGIRVRHDLFSFTRMDKIEFLVKMLRKNNLERPRMKVCNGRKTTNCCDKCSKCLQTIAALLVLGEKPIDYGFNITPEEAVEKMRLFLKRDQDYWIRWCFVVIQKKLRSMVRDGKDIPRELEWLLTTNLEQRIDVKDLKQKKVIHWKNFKDLAPKGMTIPQVEPFHIKSTKKNKKKTVEKGEES